MTTTRNGIFALAARGDSLVVSQRDVHDSTLVRRHRSQAHRDVLTRRTIRRPARDVLELLSAAMPVALDVNDDRVAKAELAARDGGDQRLESVQRPSVTSDEDREIAPDYVQDDLAFVALVLFDRGVFDRERAQNGLEGLDRGVGDLVEVLVGQLGSLNDTQLGRQLILWARPTSLGVLSEPRRQQGREGRSRP